MTDAPPAPRWTGLSPIVGWDRAETRPEPDGPQGEYASLVEIHRTPSTISDGQAFDGIPDGVSASTECPELLAPAGGPEAAYAALQYGADAVYLGLKKFSARAEAENFTIKEIDELTAFAHQLNPRRRVFVTINTLIRQDELPELVDDVASLADIGVDALIVQDLGVWQLIREHFPHIELHASTQLAVHNRAGAVALQQLGFQRVVLARELTLEEVFDITRPTGIETEVFVHGALCYSYSGLCLFSSQTLGRSGNRGKCAYSCRESFDVVGAPDDLRNGQPTKRDPKHGLPFSMKDLALPEHLPTLRAAGVSCFKIEGRKKSPLYAASTTDYYRRLLDGSMTESEHGPIEADLQTVFSRPWTHLFVQSHRDKEVADRDTTGHRGTRIGTAGSTKPGRISFVTSRPLQRHDGLQVDVAGMEKPIGFALDHMWTVGAGGRRSEVLAAAAGAHVEIAVPADAPAIPPGSAVYCSSSQAVKQTYRYSRPRSGHYRIRHSIDIVLRVAADRVSVIGTTLHGATAAAQLDGTFSAARQTTQFCEVVQSAFSKLGDSSFQLRNIEIDNPEKRFVPISKLNHLRRELIAKLTAAFHGKCNDRTAAIKRAVVAVAVERPKIPAPPSFLWSIKVDRLEHIDAFEAEDWENVDELIVDVARNGLAELRSRLLDVGRAIGRERIRLALPAITRKWEERGLLAKIDSLRADGWAKWEAANLSAWGYLGIDPIQSQSFQIDLATDWSIYVMNRLAAKAMSSLGVSRFALSPEDGRGNLQSLLKEFADQAVLIVYQDTPLFIAESCAYANLIGGCPGKANCKFESMEMESSSGERVTALDYHCRTIVLNRGPFCLSTRLRQIADLGVKRLRADFIYRRYLPVEVRNRWRAVRAGRVIIGGHSANFDRGIQ